MDNKNAFSIKLYIAPVRYDEMPAGALYTEIFAEDLEAAIQNLQKILNVKHYSAIFIRRKA